MSETKSEFTEHSEHSFLGDFQGNFMGQNRERDISKCSSNPEMSYES